MHLFPCIDIHPFTFPFPCTIVPCLVRFLIFALFRLFTQFTYFTNFTYFTTFYILVLHRVRTLTTSLIRYTFTTNYPFRSLLPIHFARQPLFFLTSTSPTYLPLPFLILPFLFQASLPFLATSSNLLLYLHISTTGSPLGTSTNFTLSSLIFLF